MEYPRHQRDIHGRIFNSRDWFLTIVLSFSSLNLFLSNDRYADCTEPLDLYLAIAQIYIVIFRLLFISTAYTENRNYYKFIFIIRNFILIPFLYAWTIIGTVWYDQSKSCLKMTEKYKNDLNGFFLFWLILTYFYLIIYTIFKVLFILHLRGIIQAPIQVRNQQQPGHQTVNRLSYEVKKSLPSCKKKNISDNTIDDCVICISNIENNDVIKILPNCLHFYHDKCINEWLIDNNNCPMCRAEIKNEKVSKNQSNEIIEKLKANLAKNTTDTNAVKVTIL